MEDLLRNCVKLYVELIDLHLLSYEKSFLLEKVDTSERQLVEKLIKGTIKVNALLKTGKSFPLLIPTRVLF